MHNAKKDAVTPQLMAKGKVAALGASFAVQMLNSSLVAAAMSVCEHLEVAETIRKRKGRYLCSGVFTILRSVSGNEFGRLGTKWSFPFPFNV